MYEGVRRENDPGSGGVGGVQLTRPLAAADLAGSIRHHDTTRRDVRLHEELRNRGRREEPALFPLHHLLPLGARDTINLGEDRDRVPAWKIIPGITRVFGVPSTMTGADRRLIRGGIHDFTGKLDSFPTGRALRTAYPRQSFTIGVTRP